MLIYRAPRAVRVHAALAQARRRMRPYQASLALAAISSLALAACSSTSPKPKIGFNPSTVTLSTVAGGTASGSVTVVNVTGSSLDGLTAAVGAYSTGASGWLTATLATTTTPTPLQLVANGANLSAGNYSAVVNVSAVGASPPTATLTVNLTVTSP